MYQIFLRIPGSMTFGLRSGPMSTFFRKDASTQTGYIAAATTLRLSLLRPSTLWKCFQWAFEAGQIKHMQGGDNSSIQEIVGQRPAGGYHFVGKLFHSLNRKFVTCRASKIKQTEKEKSVRSAKKITLVAKNAVLYENTKAEERKESPWAIAKQHGYTNGALVRKFWLTLETYHRHTKIAIGYFRWWCMHAIMIRSRIWNVECRVRNLHGRDTSPFCHT